MSEAAGLRVLAGRDADDPLEIPLEMVGTSAEPTRERRQRRVSVDVGQIHARAPDFLGPRIGCGIHIGPTPAASAITSAHRVGGGLEERDLVAPRTPARAGWPAVDAGRSNGVDEGAIDGRVAGHDGAPTPVNGINDVRW